MAELKQLSDIRRRLKEDVKAFPFVTASNASLANALLDGTRVDANHMTSVPGSTFFPIEWLKMSEHQGLATHSPPSDVRIFRSSGTTQAERSLSSFSSDGLFLYKLSAVLGFCYLLEQSPFRVNHLKGYSLIPPVSSWPDSSLAQMIEWLGEYFELTYLPTDRGPENALKQIFATKKRPAWVFGTAFHFINLLDELETLEKNEDKSDEFIKKFKDDVAKNLLIIETGGTKGRSRELSRETLYKSLTSELGISGVNIASEYGMCELASQAWSQHIDKSLAPWDQPFRFLAHVGLSVTRFNHVVKSSGTGSLVVTDPLRIDLPHPLRTQDICELNSDGTFKIINRVPKTSLKGCSLNAETFNEPEDKSKSTKTNDDNSTVSPFQTRHKPDTPPKKAGANADQNKTDALCSKVYKNLTELSKDEKFLDALKQEFNTDFVALDALEDFRASIPSTLDSFKRAVENAQCNVESVLILQPNTHSFSSIYPLYISAAYGVDISIRLPNNSQDKLAALHFVLDQLEKISPIRALSPDFRIESTWNKKDLVLAYGEDKTVQNISQLTGNRTLEFGFTSAISVVFNHGDENFHLAMKDFYSLNQRGCMSSRICFMNKSLRRKFLEFLQKSFQEKKYGFKLSLNDICSVDHEQTMYLTNHHAFVERAFEGNPLIPLYHITNTENLADFSSARSFVFPVVFFDPDQVGSLQFKNIRGLKYLSTDDKPTLNKVLSGSTAGFAGSDPSNYKDERSYDIRSLGTLNQTKWNGYHEGKRLLYLSNPDVSR